MRDRIREEENGWSTTIAFDYFRAHEKLMEKKRAKEINTKQEKVKAWKAREAEEEMARRELSPSEVGQGCERSTGGWYPREFSPSELGYGGEGSTWSEYYGGGGRDGE